MVISFKCIFKFKGGGGILPRRGEDPGPILAVQFNIYVKFLVRHLPHLPSYIYDKYLTT